MTANNRVRFGTDNAVVGASDELTYLLQKPLRKKYPITQFLHFVPRLKLRQRHWPSS